MCGICGIVGYDRIDRDDLVRMASVLRHRGPDDEGFLIQGYEDGLGVGLGFRRLSIIDLTTGNQPIANETQTVQLVFNGEIYNFLELRQELAARGHRFSTHADTEVIVHLYEEMGGRCVERLNGMFAFGLWDASRRELLLARDRFGEKPLYYAEVGRSLIFGSELKSLLQHPECQRRLDFESLTRYLALEYVPQPESIIEGVRKLPAGHVLRWSSGQSSVEPYWDLSFSDDPDRSTDEEFAHGLREHLRSAVRRRLVSDVPLGAFLSGGIDSSSIVALMVEAMPAEQVKTFNIGFGERSFDESEHARRVARHFGTDHHEDVFTPNVMLDLLPSVIDFLDEPFADASILPTYLLSRFTREHVTVALGGDGSDELLAGYPTFTADRLAKLYVLPRVLHQHVVMPLVNRLPVSTSNFSVDFKLKRFVRAVALPPETRHATWLGSFAPAELDAVLLGDAGDVFKHQRSTYRASPSSDELERAIYLYAKTYLQDDILVKVDRASMATSLEVRAPFLDMHLVEFLGRVPSRLKLRRLDTKYLLKEAMADLLPPGIASRRKKGFGIPIAQWFKKELRGQLQEELSVARLKAQGIFEPAEVQRLLAEHLTGRRDHRKSLWTLFVFQLWHRRWMEAGHGNLADARTPATAPSSLPAACP